MIYPPEDIKLIEAGLVTPQLVLRKNVNGQLYRFYNVSFPQKIENIKKIISDNKKLIRVVVPIIVLIAIIVYLIHKKEIENSNKSNQVFEEYLKSLINGTITEAQINDMMMELEKIKKSKKVKLSENNINLLTDIIKNYTIQLAKENSFKMSENDFENTDNLKKIEQYLKIQQQVFKKCASIEI